MQRANPFRALLHEARRAPLLSCPQRHRDEYGVSRCHLEASSPGGFGIMHGQWIGFAPRFPHCMDRQESMGQVGLCSSYHHFVSSRKITVFPLKFQPKNLQKRKKHRIFAPLNSKAFKGPQNPCNPLCFTTIRYDDRAAYRHSTIICLFSTLCNGKSHINAIPTLYQAYTNAIGGLRLVRGKSQSNPSFVPVGSLSVPL